jgi:hypothetical protein
MIAVEVGVSRGTAYKYLVEITKKGLFLMTVRRSQPISRKTAMLTALRSYSLSIRCGTPEEERAEIKEYVSLPASIFGYGEFLYSEPKRFHESCWH